MNLPSLDHWSNGVPFMAVVANASPKMSMTRIVEAIIIAGITAMLTSVMLTARLDERLSAQKEHNDFRFSEVDKRQEWIMDKITDHLMIQRQSESVYKNKGGLP